jgi:superfamily I DNA/RNA helicase
MLSDAEFQSLLSKAVPLLNRLWDDMLNHSGRIPFGHDGYLKHWALSEPVIDADYIMLDEAQDSNAVIISVLRKQKCQLIFVGDPYQQIYDWRGAINAMNKLKANQQAFLTQSFRFGPAIATAATRILQTIGATKEIRGNQNVQSEICPVLPPDAILCRTNFGVFANLVFFIRRDVKCHVLGGTEALHKMLQDVRRLKSNIPAQLSEFFGFRNWAEVFEFAMQPEGEHLKSFVQLVNEHGEERLIEIVNKCEPTEKHADLVVSTTHKAKGLEWNRVLVDKDFDASFGKTCKLENRNLVILDRKKFAEDTRVLYVAMTRARDAVELPQGVMSYFGLKNTREEPIGYPLSTSANR